MFTSPSASEYSKYLLTIIKNMVIKLTKRRYYTVNVLVNTVIYMIILCVDLTSYIVFFKFCGANC